VKIAFDENVPAAMVRTFQALAQEKRFKRMIGAGCVVSAKDYTPTVSDTDYIRKSDVPWMRRYKADGGQVFCQATPRWLKTRRNYLRYINLV
jgi:hypothetical protein